MQTFLKVIIVLCVVLAAGLTTFLVLPKPPLAVADDEVDGYPAATVSYGTDGQGGDVLFVDGLLVGATMKAVRASLEGHAGRITRMQITSAGGLGPAADRLAALVNTRHLPVRVAANKICSSACVFFLAAVEPGLRRIDDAAWLRVHGNGVGADQDAAPMRMMDQPVEAMSRNWHRFLDACPSKPLNRNAGIAMTWGEIQQVDRNPSSLDCRKMAYRTKDWLFARY